MATVLRPEERYGLLAALALHAGLAAALLLRPAPRPLPLPERIEVSLSDNVGLTSTAPQPQAKAAPDAAPLLGEPAPAPQPVPQPVLKPAPQPKPQPKAVVKPEPRPQAKPQPQPKVQPKAEPRPAPARAKDRQVPDPIADALARAKAKPATKPAGASRIGADFLKGIAGGEPGGKAATPGAKVLDAKAQAALAASLSRQIKRYWRVPQGVETDELVTVLEFYLNRDGTLSGAPRVVHTIGQTASNSPQVKLHQEQAIRAVVLAAKEHFLLPPQYYDDWKHVRFRFDRKLSQ